jgi:hypothetical protein
MPIKLRPSVTNIDRNTKKVTINHYYIKTTPLKELLEYLESSNARPRVVQKIKNELIRREFKHNLRD